jgi:hypothetical protein
MAPGVIAELGCPATSLMLSHTLCDRNFWALNGPRQLPLVLLERGLREKVKRWEVDGLGGGGLFRDAVSIEV